MKEFIRVIELMVNGNEVDIDDIKTIQFLPTKDIEQLANEVYRDAIIFASDYDIYKTDYAYKRDRIERLAWQLTRLKQAIDASRGRN